MLVNLKQFLTLGTFIQGLWTDGLQTHLPTESPSNTPLRGIIDEELSSYMMRVIDDWRVKGLSLAIVRSDREVEYGSWGISSEDEKKVTPAVRSLVSLMFKYSPCFRPCSGLHLVPKRLRRLLWVS